MTPVETFTLVRTLKGAPLSILILMLITRQSHTNQFFIRFTGYSDKTVAAALGLLQELSLVAPSPGGWRLVSDQPFLLQLNTENFRPSSSGSNNNSISEENLLLPPDTEKFRQNIEAFRRLGYDLNPTVDRLARQEHVTPEYIEAHTTRVHAEDQSLGLAIWRMQRQVIAQSQPKRGYASGELAEYIQT